MKKDNQIIIFLATLYLAKPSFYSKSKKNYTIFYEEIDINKKYYNKNVDSINKKELFIL